MASSLLGRRQSQRPLAFIGILHFKVATSWGILREVVNFEQTGVFTLPKFSAHGRGLAEGSFNSHASSGHGGREQWRTNTACNHPEEMWQWTYQATVSQRVHRCSRNAVILPVQFRFAIWKTEDSFVSKATWQPACPNATEWSISGFAIAARQR
jgi:hypothetical protein